MGQGWHNHLDSQKIFPYGGWGAEWTGLPDRGMGKRQPGGWIYNILPFMEFKSLHDQGNGLTRNTSVDNNSPWARAMIARDATPLSVATCPTRRQPLAYPNSTTWGKMQYFAPMVTRTDYAANQGDGTILEYNQWPQAIDPPFTNWPWDDKGNSPSGNTPMQTGINFMNSYLRPIDVKDGLAHTYMIGEKYLNPDHYLDGQDGADDWCMLSGAQNDINRLCANDANGYYVPSRDRRGFSNQYPFGSAHASSFNMVMCDGSAQSIRYDIDLVLHSRLGNRSDRKPTDMTGL
jgi:hypothetical protein